MKTKRDRSYGIIPLRKVDGAWQLFVIQHKAGHWAFPKGHADPGESPRQAAERELLEESGLRVRRYVLPGTFSERYRFHHEGSLILKTVSYRAAEVEGDVTLQLDEVVDFCWVPIDDASSVLSFNEARKMVAEVTVGLQASTAGGE